MLRLLLPVAVACNLRPRHFTFSVCGDSSRNGTFIVLVVVLVLPAAISSGPASTVTLILHGLEFWRGIFFDGELNDFDVLRFSSYGDAIEMSSTNLIDLDGDERGSLMGDEWEKS